MLTIFFIIFILFSVLFFSDIKNETVKRILFFICALILILLAGFRGRDDGMDYYVYQDFWRTKNLDGKVDYSFYLLKTFVKNNMNAGFQTLLLLYAILGVSAKVIAFRKLSSMIFGTLLIYFSHYFILHEFTQIRIGVATGFMLISLYYLSIKKYIIFYFLAAVAIFFHQSCFFIVVFPLFQNSSKHIRIYYWLIPLGYLLYFFNTYFNISVPIPGIQDKIDAYEEATKSGFLKEEKINVFNALFLIRITILYVLMYFAKKLSENLPSYYLLLKIYSLSLFSFLFLSRVPVFSFRIQELLGVVEIILIPCLVYIFADRFKYLGKILVWSIALVIFLLDIFYVKLIFVK